MRNLFICLVMMLILASSAMATVAVCNTDATVIVDGQVTDLADNAVAGATVTVTCMGNPLTTTSLSDGNYAVLYTNKDGNCCDIGTIANVHAVKGDASGSNSGTVDDPFAEPINIGIAVVDVSIPEFGVIAAGVAMIGAMAGIVLFRRH